MKCTLCATLSLKLKKSLNLLLELKITYLLKWAAANFNSNGCFPKNGKPILISFLGTVETTFLTAKMLSRKTLTHGL